MEMALGVEGLERVEAGAVVAATARAEITARPFDDLAATHALYEARVFRFLLYSVRDRDVAMTLCQETFLAAWRSRESFRGECSAATWLLKIAVNLLRSHVRGERYKFWQRAVTLDVTEMTEPPVDPRRSAEATLVVREQLASVWTRVEKLSGRQRTVFLLRFVEEMELPEIAESMGLPLSTVKSHLYRALDHVREAAKEYSGKERV